MKTVFIFMTLICLVTQAKDTHSSDPHSVTVNTTSAHHEATNTHHQETSSVTGEKAYSWMKNGNSRFVSNKLRKDGQNLSDRQRLAKGQKPHTIVLSCSDSRVPPELVFDQKLGEIFVVRTAGEALDNAGIASIEYAVSHLGPKLIIVMGHESCGAVKAALDTLAGADAGSPSLNSLVKDLHPRLKNFSGKAPSEGVITETRTNALGVAQDLITRSKIIENAVKNENLLIKVAVYRLATGKVEFID